MRSRLSAFCRRLPVPVSAAFGKGRGSRDRRLHPSRMRYEASDRPTNAMGRSDTEPAQLRTIPSCGKVTGRCFAEQARAEMALFTGRRADLPVSTGARRLHFDH